MAREINHVIDQLSKIEASSNGILGNADKEKKEYALLMEQKTKEFDDALQKETSDKLEQIKADLQVEAEKELEVWNSESESQLKEYDLIFAEKHKILAQEILDKIVNK